MPAIIVHSLELTEKQKEFLAENYIALFSRATNVPPDRIYIFFDGHSLDNAGTNGKLFSKMGTNPRVIGKWNQEREDEEIWTSMKP